MRSTMTASALKAWRHRMGWDRQEDASARLEVAPATYKAYENGQRIIPKTVAQLTRLIEQQTPARIPSEEGSPIRIAGGGTVFHLRNHFSLCVNARGTTAKALAALCARKGQPAELVLTGQADPASSYVTNEDMTELAEEWIADPRVRIVFWNAAILDFEGQIGDVAPGPKATRLRTADGPVQVDLTPCDKIVNRFRRTRKDLFLVAFKSTAGASADEQYRAGLALLKNASANLVLANDTVTGLNMVVVPEEARYHETKDRGEALAGLVEMALLRSRNTFTRSTVVEGGGIPWSDPSIPDNLREVVRHCIARGAYKPFQGKTVGHFAVRGPDGSIITSRRKSDFNRLPETGMVRIVPDGKDTVVSYGGKPSVGGMSQRIIFDSHPDAWNIVHFHCPLRPDAPDAVPIREQRPYECGSHECGRNTSDGLRAVAPGIKAVMLDDHGPNIVYGKDVPAESVVAFIERNFDLSGKTGGPVT